MAVLLHLKKVIQKILSGDQHVANQLCVCYTAGRRIPQMWFGQQDGFRSKMGDLQFWGHTLGLHASY
jgi:hypothetical protein